MATPRSDRTTEEILEEKFRKKEERKEREPSTPRKLKVERTQTGLYFLRYEGGGQLPEAFKGLFSSIYKIR